MSRKADKLRFTEDEYVTADAGDAAAGADELKKRVRRKNQQKLRMTGTKQPSAGSKLKIRQDAAEAEELQVGRKRAQAKSLGPGKTVLQEAASAPIREKLNEAAEDNSEVEAFSYTPEAVQTVKAVGETAGKSAEKTGSYAKKLVSNIHSEKLQEGTGAAAYQTASEATESSEAADLAADARKFQQKKQIRKQYQAMKRTSDAAAAAADSGFSFQGIAETLSKAKDKGIEYVSTHSGQILIVVMIAGLLLIVINMLSSCSMMGSSVSDVVWTSSYTATDADILAVEADYEDLEAALQEEIDNIESSHPGYDEYNYYLDEIGHDPYELASYLTVVFEDYTRDEVQATLQQLFDEQYELTLDSVVERRTRTVEYDDGTTGEEEYDYYILNVYLKNNNLGEVILEQGMNDSDTQRYELLNTTYGNRPDLFADDIYAISTGEYEDYDIPGEALTDSDFANMINEAEKYLGMAYVWGGSSPSTGFDCSGFVSYVINNCGNGWDVGRCTANGLLSNCTRVSKSEAQPGDLIFFQGTYNTSGASHCGIYVGDGMMIHCGNPISYTSINTSYWQSHFYTFGRLNQESGD